MRAMEEKMELSLESQLKNKISDMYTSLSPVDEQDKITLYNVLQNCDKAVADCLDTPIHLRNVVAQKYNKVDDVTGEVTENVRTILIDEDGTSYGSASKGLFNSLTMLFSTFGMPDTWTKSIPIKVVETKTRKGQKTFTIKVLQESTNNALEV